MNTKIHYTVKIGTKEYGRAFSEGWMSSLAVYVALTKLHTGKNFYFKHKQKTKRFTDLAKQLGITYTAFAKHIKILQQEQLLEVYTNEVRLKSMRKMSKMCVNYVYVPNNVNTYKDIKGFLKTIPFLSNIKKQQKAIDKKERLINISNKMNRKISVSKRDYREYLKFMKNGEPMELNSKIQIGVKRIGEVMGMRSRHTVVKYKKLLKQLGIIDYQNTMTLHFLNQSREALLYLKEVGEVPKYAFRTKKGNIYSYDISTFIPVKVSSICIKKL